MARRCGCSLDAFALLVILAFAILISFVFFCWVVDILRKQASKQLTHHESSVS
jgi:hypothetical protein